MDIKNIAQQIIKLIDERIEKYMLHHNNSSHESVATVLQIHARTYKATVQFVDNEDITMTLTNKSGEVLSIGDSVYVSWRGVRAANTAFIARRGGVPHYPLPSQTNTHIQRIAQVDYQELDTTDTNTLYVVVAEDGAVSLYLGDKRI